MTRAESFNERFKTIQRTLEELYGRERAFGAATAAWLMAIQYMARQSLRKLERKFGDDASVAGTWNPTIEALDEEMEGILQSFHAEICEHLSVNQAAAWKLARAFKEVIDDVCYKGD